MENGVLHVVMLPWLAFGHMLPFLDLAKRIAEKGHHVSFLSTSRNIQRLPKIPPSIASRIKLVELPLPRIENLPEGAEATIDLPTQDSRPYLRMAFDALEKNLQIFLQENRSTSPDWIIHDYAPYWVPPAAAKFDIPCAFFSVFNAAVLSFMGPPSTLKGGEGARTEPEHFTVSPDWIPFPSPIAFRKFEAEELFRPSVLPDASGVSEAYRFGATIEGCDVVAVRSCTEFEPDWFRLLGEISQKPVIPVGLLPPLIQEFSDGEESDKRWGETFEWLGRQEPGSVVYVASGSEVKLSRAQVHEIALGLELSELPFFWALRKPYDQTSGRNMLPDGFEARTKARGIVCMDWVPQIRVLAHSSVGGFLMHSGWSSVVEGLAFGLALILLPMMFNQGLDARYLVEKGIGMEVPRNEEDGSFTGDGIAETLRLAMVGEEGAHFKAKAREIREIFGDQKLQDKCLEDFIKYLADHRRSKII